jgi:hypothetical protein
MARIGRWLISVSGDDYRRRVLGLSVLIHLRAYLDHAPQLKNKLGAAGVTVAGAEQALARLRGDFESDYKRVRDKLGAHRQDLDMVDRLELWNAVDQLSTTLLVDDANDAWQALASSSGSLWAVDDFPAVRDEKIAAGFGHSERTTGPGFEHTADNLGYAQENTASPVLIPGMQERFGQVISIVRFGGEVSVMSALTADRDVHRILQGLFVVSALNLLENLFPSVQVSKAEHRPQTLMAAFDADGRPEAGDVLREAEAKLDISLIARILSVRGHIAAHIDQQQPLKASLAELDQLSMDDVSQLLRAPYDALREACTHVPSLALMSSIEGMRTSGYARLKPRAEVSPFNLD